MKSTTTPTDLQSLTQDYYPAAYSLQLQAEELAAADDFEGYTEWSEDLDAVWMAEQEKQAWDGAQPVVLDDGAQVLIKRECTHKECGFKCKKSVRIGGIEI